MLITGKARLRRIAYALSDYPVFASLDSLYDRIFNRVHLYYVASFPLKKQIICTALASLRNFVQFLVTIDF